MAMYFPASSNKALIRHRQRKKECCYSSVKCAVLEGPEILSVLLIEAAQELSYFRLRVAKSRFIHQNGAYMHLVDDKGHHNSG